MACATNRKQNSIFKKENISLSVMFVGELRFGVFFFEKEEGRDVRGPKPNQNKHQQ